MRALIVDDEKQSRNLIRQFLQSKFPQIGVEEAVSVDDAKKKLKAADTELIFLDVNLGSETGFDLLDQVTNTDARVIFITAHSEYAVRAFKYSAVDYLVKPIDPDEFEQAVQRATHPPEMKSRQNIQYLQAHLKESPGLYEKLVIPTLEGFQLTNIPEIIYCKANGNYTEIILSAGKKIISSYTLAHFDDVLTPHAFLRIHRSHLINLNHVLQYKRGEGGAVTMSNGDQLDISRANKEAFLQHFKS